MPVSTESEYRILQPKLPFQSRTTNEADTCESNVFVQECEDYLNLVVSIQEEFPDLCQAPFLSAVLYSQNDREHTENKDPYLTDEIRHDLGINANPDTDVIAYQHKTERTEQDRHYIRKQIETYLQERVLGVDKNTIENMYQLRNGFLISSFQSDLDTPFVYTQAQQLFAKCQSYFDYRFHHNPDPHEVWWIVEHFDEIEPYLFSDEFTKTTQAGLEKEELRYMLAMQHFLRNGQEGETFVVPSAFSDLRFPDSKGIKLNIIMLASLQIRDQERYLTLQNIFLKEVNWEEFLEKIQSLYTEENFNVQTPQDLLQLSRSFPASPAEILNQLHITINDRVLTIDEAALNRVSGDVDALVEATLQGNITKVYELRSQIVAKLTSYHHTFLSAYRDEIEEENPENYQTLRQLELRMENYDNYEGCPGNWNTELGLGEQLSGYEFRYDSTSTCNLCGRSGAEVRLGPCNICESCQSRYDRGEIY